MEVILAQSLLLPRKRTGAEAETNNPINRASASEIPILKRETSDQPPRKRKIAGGKAIPYVEAELSLACSPLRMKGSVQC